VPRHHHLLPSNPSSQHSRPPWQPLLRHHRPYTTPSTPSLHQKRRGHHVHQWQRLHRERRTNCSSSHLQPVPATIAERCHHWRRTIVRCPYHVHTAAAAMETATPPWSKLPHLREANWRASITTAASHHHSSEQRRFHYGSRHCGSSSFRCIFRNPNLGERRSCHVSFSQWTLKWSKLVKAGQTVNSGQRLVKREGFNCKYWYFWMSLQNWTTELKIGYLEN